MSTENLSCSKYLEVTIPPEYENSFISPRQESVSLSSKMKKMLSSPKVIRGKAAVTANKTFGVPLEFLYERDKTEVPLIVTRICEYLQSYGLHHEGLFRVNGNIKVVDRLKTSFDKCGDADLEDIGDVPACASLLKMFLRELTDAVIPDDLQPLFITVQDQYGKEKEKALPLVKELIKRMPRLNSCLLKYLCEFIRKISEESNVNKMNLLALAIVFGPNIFRCGDGLEGLKEQAYVNAVLLSILEGYKELFLINNEIFPDSTMKIVPEKPTPYIEHMKMKKEKKDKPARPPPPQLSLDDELVSVETSPKDSPGRSPTSSNQKRSSKRKSPKSGSKNELIENKIQSPKKRTPSKKEPTRSSSPTQFSSPLSKHLVDNTISTAVKEHIFGSGLVTSSVESDIFDDMAPLQTSEVAHMYPSVKDRIQKFSVEQNEEQPYKKVKASEKDQTLRTKSQLTVPDQDAYVNLTDDDLDFLQGTSSSTLEPLTSDRAEPPKHRRKPSPVIKSTRSSSYKEAKSNSIYDSDEFFRPKESEKEIITSNSNLSEKNGWRQLKKSQSVPLGDSDVVGKSISLVPALELDCSQDEKEEVQKSSREKYNMMFNEYPVRSPHSAPSSPRTTEKRHEFWKDRRQDTVPIVDMTPQELRKRIASLKKIISNFESNFEETNGRKVKPSDKVHIQKYIADIGRAKKQLKELLSDYKECPELLAETASFGPDFGTAPKLREPLFDSENPSKEQTLKNLLKKLEDKRLAAGRPHELLIMNIDQLKDEKLAVQKVLLQYENLHGRPNAKEDKTLMRPLYDRYRKIKRRIATGKVESPSKQSLVSNIHVDHESPLRIPIAKESENTPGRHSQTANSRVPLTENSTNIKNHLREEEEEDEDEEEEEGENINGTLGDTFSVTRHIRDPDTPEPFSPRDESPRSIDEAVLHDATISELLDQQRTTKRVKKKLGRQLKDFEDEFFKTWNRKMQKEDRLPREGEYREYKMVKAKLRLIEALIAKKSGNNTV